MSGRAWFATMTVAGLFLAGFLLAGVTKASDGPAPAPPGEETVAAEPMPEKELERLRGTVNDLKRLGKAYASWASDNAASVPAAERSRLQAEAKAARDAMPPMPKGFYLWREGTLRRMTSNEMARRLRPTSEIFYLRNLPVKDRWGTRLEILGAPENLFGREQLALRSAGPNGRFDGDRVPIGGWHPGDGNDDIVWVDGAFQRWPVAASPEAGVESGVGTGTN